MCLSASTSLLKYIHTAYDHGFDPNPRSPPPPLRFPCPKSLGITHGSAAGLFPVVIEPSIPPNDSPVSGGIPVNGELAPDANGFPASEAVDPANGEAAAPAYGEALDATYGDEYPKPSPLLGEEKLAVEPPHPLLLSPYGEDR